MTCEHGLTTKECYVCSSPKYVERQQALDKMAENERELGIQMQPDEPVAWDNCRAEYQCRRWCGNLGCVSHTRPQPTDEPVAWMHNMIEGVAVTHKPLDLERHPERWVALYKNPTPCKTCEALARTVMMDQGGTA